ncbi:MAG TPA: DUF2490 domain-containing protein [Pyrinomonadaceae bacterium]|nr:DUF2490 domain-containing protein [Pyrinomonadaceae bacterium]
MELLRFFILLLLVSPALVASGFSQTPVDSDFQFWNDNTFVVPLISSPADGNKKTDKFSLLILQTNRVGTNGLHAADERLGLGFDLFVNKHLSISPTYVFRAAHALPRHWQYEHRLRLDATLSKDWASVGVKNRNRVERLIRNSRSDLTRYRNRTTVRFPLNPESKHRVDAFGMVEPNYEFTRGIWTVLDIGGGITTKLAAKLSTDIYFIHRGPLKDHVPHINAIGFNLKLSLD